MSDTHCYRNKKVSLVCTLDTFWQLLRHKFFLSEEPKVTFVINPYITLKFLENSQCFKASPLVLCIYCKINAARGITCKIHKNSHYCSFVQFAKQVVNKTLSRQAKIFFNLWLVFLASHNDLFKNREIDLQCFKKILLKIQNSLCSLKWHLNLSIVKFALDFA